MEVSNLNQSCLVAVCGRRKSACGRHVGSLIREGGEAFQVKGEVGYAKPWSERFGDHNSRIDGEGRDGRGPGDGDTLRKVLSLPESLISGSVFSESDA